MMPSPSLGRAGTFMDWARILAYVTGTVDQELLGRTGYLAAGPAPNVIRHGIGLPSRAEPRPARTLPAQDGHLMSQGDEFEHQRGAAAHPEREQGTEGGQKPKHADDGMTEAPKLYVFQAFWSFE